MRAYAILMIIDDDNRTMFPMFLLMHRLERLITSTVVSHLDCICNNCILEINCCTQRIYKN